MRKKSGLITTIIFVIILLVGLSVMLYPIVSNWWNQNMASHTIKNYSETVAEFDDTKLRELLDEAYSYNQSLNKLYNPLSNHEALENYNDVLDVSGTGIMGVIKIPCINVELPIYHGTSESVLQIAVGHIEGSSLPVGGESTHSLLSGHRGLPSAKLFSDLDKMVKGDTFTISILDEVLTYEVENIYIVLPHEVDKLTVIPGEDYVTLVTCTPYGVNTHRLLVQARRIETEKVSNVRVLADAFKVDSMIVITMMFILLLMILMIIWAVNSRFTQKIQIDKYIIDKLPRKE